MTNTERSPGITNQPIELKWLCDELCLKNLRQRKLEEKTEFGPLTCTHSGKANVHRLGVGETDRQTE